MKARNKAGNCCTQDYFFVGKKSVGYLEKKSQGSPRPTQNTAS